MSAQNRLAGGSQRDRRTVRNAIVFTIWIFLFSVSFLAGHWLLDAAGWKPEGAVGVAYSLLPVITVMMIAWSLGTIFASWRYR